MQVYEHECPDCHCRLRLRGPLREGHDFKCPDCAASLTLHVHSGGSEVARAPDNAAVGVRTTSASTPKIIAWTVAGLMLLGFGVFVFSGPEEPEPEHQKPVSKPPAIAITQPEPEEPAAPVEVPGNPILPPGPDESEPIDVPMVAVDEPAPEDLVPSVPATVVPEPVIDAPPPEPIETAEEAEARLKAERDAASIAATQQRLSLPLLSYESSEDLTLQAFLTEMSGLAATRIVDGPVASKSDMLITLSVENTTVGEVLSAGLKQAKIIHQVRPNGIYLSSE